MKSLSTWGVCAVCIPRESYYWLQDWIDHHIKAGASKIVIYDNTGSTGSTRASSVFRTGRLQIDEVSKRGERYGALTDMIADFEIQDQLRRWAAEYPDDKVEIVTWQPKDPASGQIVHGQVEAYVDFIRKYRDSLDWGLFIDLDEYIYCKPGLSVASALSFLSTQIPNAALVQLQAWRFECRWGKSGPKDIRTFRSHLPLVFGGEKNLVRLQDVKAANIHWDWVMMPWTTRVMAHADDLAFCHYNQYPQDIQEAGLSVIHPRAFLSAKVDPGMTFRINRALPSQGTEHVAPIVI